MAGQSLPGFSPPRHLHACVCWTPSYLTVKQQVQLPVNPLLDIQPPLQVLPVVFHRQLAQLALCRFFRLLDCLEHHPGLGARI